MSNNKRFVIGAIAAVLTFGGLKVFVGQHRMGRHHRPNWEHHHRCGEHVQHQGCEKHGDLPKEQLPIQ